MYLSSINVSQKRIKIFDTERGLKMKNQDDFKRGKDDLFPEFKDRIVFALNTSDLMRAEWLITMLFDHVGYFKPGLEFISAILAAILGSSDSVAADNLATIRRIFIKAKGRILLDGRMAGVVNAIGPATKNLSDLGVSMLSVQVRQSVGALGAAAKNKGHSLLLASTPRSSVDFDECPTKGLIPGDAVLRMIERAGERGVDGIICSSHETSWVRKTLPDTLIFTRDIRPLWVPIKKRHKVMTPKEAIAAGADAVIIGKPISQPPPSIGNPTQAAELLVQEIAEAHEFRQANIRKGG